LPAQRLEQGRLRVAVSSLALEHAAQARPPARARGVEPRRAGVGGDRLAIAALPLEHEPEAPVERGLRGPQRGRRAVGLRRLAPAPLAPVGLGMLEVYTEGGGIETRGAAEGGRRVAVPSQGGQRRAEAGVGDRARGGEANRLLEGAHRLLRPPEPPEGHREGVLRFAAARGQPHRLARGGLLLASLAEAAAHRGEAQPRGGVIALAADGGAEGGLGGGPLALTLEGEAELEL